jgi:Fe-S cluster assembly iron-binding protein IscA
MALDEPRESDLTYVDRDVTIAIEKELLEQIKPVRVDFVQSAEGSGFQLASSLAKGEGCGGSCDC